jgi:hypothetical protein
LFESIILDAPEGVCGVPLGNDDAVLGGEGRYGDAADLISDSSSNGRSCRPPDVSGESLVKNRLWCKYIINHTNIYRLSVFIVKIKINNFI